MSDSDAAENYSKIVGLYKAGSYADALPLALELRRMIEKRFGVSSAAYGAAAGILARLNHALGKYEQAEDYVKQALAIEERDSGPKHLNLANDLGVLGQIYEEQGKYDDAESVMKRALRIEEDGNFDPADIARALNNIAWLYQEQGRFDDAEAPASRSLSLFQKALGEKDADYGRTLDTLAKISEGQGHLSDAEEQYRKAIAVLEQALGPDHDAVAASLENLGGLLKSQRRLDEAEQLLKRALEIKKHVYGADSPNNASTMSQLGDLYRQQGRSEEAEAQFQLALALHKESMREITVFFATDRVRNKDAKSVAFGDDQSESLIFGRATVVVAKPAQGDTRLSFVSPVSLDNTIITSPRVETTSVDRLAIRKTEIVADLKSSRQRADTATVFPKQAFVFVHGFNVSFENALRRVAQIAYDLNFDGPAILFSWPSQGGWLSYFKDRDNASVAANHLKALLEQIPNETGAAKIHLIAHSMGNVVLLDALEKIKLGHPSGAGLGFAEIVLASPDIAKSRFSQLMSGIKDLGSGTTLYASQSDRALNLSSWIWGERAGAAPSVVSGVETIDTTAAGSSFFGLNHDLYVSNPTIFNDMRTVMELGQHPPDRRSAAFAPVVTPNGTYWIYHRKADTEKTFVMVSPTAEERESAHQTESEAPAEDTSYVKALGSQVPLGEVSTGLTEDVESLQRDLEIARQEAQAARREADETRRQLELDRAAKQGAEQARDQSANADPKAQQKTGSAPTEGESSSGHPSALGENKKPSTAHETASDAKPPQDASATTQSPSSPSQALPSSTDRPTLDPQEPPTTSSIAKGMPPSKGDVLKNQRQAQVRSPSSLRKHHLHRDAADQRAWPYSEWH